MDGSRPRRVAIIGARFGDVSIEQRVLGPLGVEILIGNGSSPEALVKEATGAEVILAGSRPRFDADTIERLGCRGIVRYGVGTEKIDLEAAARCGTLVAYVPDYGTEAVAVHAVTLALASIRRLAAADALVKRGDWGVENLRPLHSPSTLTAGVVGVGRIGRRVAGQLAALGFEVLGHDPLAEVPPEIAIEVPLDRLLAESDVVSLHSPGHADSTPLLGRDELALMKEGSALVNTARGSLIDGAALVEGLAGGRPGIAALDVFAEEPPDLALFEPVMERLILTPHMAWYTEEAELDLRTKAAEEARRILLGEPPLNPVTVKGSA